MFLSKLLSANEDIPKALKRNVYISNSLSLSCAICTAIILGGVLYFWGFQLEAYLIILVMLLFFFVVILNKKGYYDAGRLLMCLSPIWFTLAIAIISKMRDPIPDDMGFYDTRIVLIGTSILPLLVFNLNERWKLGICLFSTIFCLTFLDPIHDLLGIGYFQMGFTGIRYYFINYIALSATAALVVGVIILKWFTEKAEAETENAIREKDKINVLLQAQNEWIAKTNNELIEKNATLIRLNEEINNLISSIVHDLKTPLNTVYGLLQLLEHESSGNKNVTDKIQIAYKVLNNGKILISQLLAMREAENVNIVLQKSRFNLADLLHEVEIDFSLSAKQKAIEISIQAENIVIETEKALLKRIIENLLSNAIKFSPQGKKIEVRTRINNGDISIEVKDEGPGFKKDEMSKAFTKFQRLSARPTNGESSNGLGLTIVKLLSDKLNATVDLKSSAGDGAAFTVKIPEAYVEYA